MSLEELINTLNELKNSEFETEPSQILEKIAKFYMEKFMVDEDEISFLFIDADGLFLRFFYPPYLKDAGLLPVKFTESIATQVFNLGFPRLINNVALARHFSLFESVKSSKGKSLPIQKMLVSPIISPDGKRIGVIQVLRKGKRADDVSDFTETDLDYLHTSVSKLFPFLKDFAGQRIKK